MKGRGGWTGRGQRPRLQPQRISSRAL